MDNANKMDKIVGINIEDEMKNCYIDYAMSVIVSRALPDVRDGLKPVQRRILYSMEEMNLEPNKPYKKSARIVGDTMGKYHPHGDSSIYQAMVRMAQNFSMRYVLVDGHGNFGSVDGDGAAAQRYTEARMSRISLEMLADIDKNTVDFIPNYSEEVKEPTVLPARVPNLLINGSSGIAVGMATNIPPHNLSEVIDGVVKMIDNYVQQKRETSVEELMEVIKAPDFPTGGIIMGKNGIRSAYRTGRGKIRVRAVSEIEAMPNGRERIVVTEIPYQVNKARLIEKIADLVKEKRVDGISDIRDESNRKGMRIVIELKKDANTGVVLNNLYKYTQLEDSFGVIMIALVNNKPEVLNLKQVLEQYLKHQKEVVTRRTQFELDKAEKRAHLLEGLRIALDNIDEVIRIIRSSYDDAKSKLMEKFGLSEIQTQAILEMQLRRLQGLEYEKIDKEYRELTEKIKEYKAILSDETLLYGVIKEEILIVKAKYGDVRRTQIMQHVEVIEDEDLIDEETSVFTLSHLNYIKRTPLMTYKSQKRGGRGIMGMNTREEDFVKDLFLGSTHDYILFFTNKGRVYRLKGYEVPEAGRTARGNAIVNLIEISNEETITAMIPVKEFTQDSYLVMITKEGIIKKTDMMSFSNIRKGGLTALSLKEEDNLIAVLVTNGNDEILVATKNGMGIKFHEKDVRPMSRQAMGVKAITLKQNDYVVSSVKITEGTQVLNVTEKGYGKRTNSEDFNVQYRGGKGVKIHQLTEKTGLLTGVLVIDEKEELMLITSEGVIIRLRGNEISSLGRVSQGVKLINLNENVSVVGVAKISEQDIQMEEEQIEETEQVEQ
ncbi:DNA gyrase subunit A [Clostridium sp. MD294]|uniref:DNA gyrase subunit A n=1 Tax=Clostridium sp. MD294 TaxID=97138 RepID=UPI0002CBC54D|nr:DNA gyrase subunit A [Clostridium sp. MD294]NDO46263.1 DNA gyrase subunit A [Clostridium sp. MD294]USF29310.1 DNA gyrase subunit A [Clostridium sp. MD294]